ncbi:RAMP superfamily CRISPR-associated protein [Streptomyces sp. NPDC001680]
MTHTPAHTAAGSLTVRTDFHGPFRIGTGRPAPGADDTVDRDDPLPASSLKGVMRASAAWLLPGGAHLVDRVFGTARQPSPWHWSGADFGEQPPRAVVRARIAIDPVTGTAREDHLLHVEEHWARNAQFTVTRTAYLPPEEAADQLAVLACAAAGVHALGADRRRGLGWVTCTPTAPAVDDQVLARFETLRAAHVRTSTTQAGGSHA